MLEDLEQLQRIHSKLLCQSPKRLERIGGIEERTLANDHKTNILVKSG